MLFYSFKILVSEGKYKNNLKNRESQKKKKKNNNNNNNNNNNKIKINTEILWFYQDF